ncbi:hypothetical protein D3C72_1275070 [compost metagenome]
MQDLRGLLAHGHVDALRHGNLPQALLHLGNARLVAGQFGIGMLHGVVQMAHQPVLHPPLAGKGCLPLLLHPVFHYGGAAVLTVFDHAVDAQRRQLLVAAGRRAIDGVHDAVRQFRQKAPGQPLHVSVVHFRPDLSALVQAQFREHGPSLAVVSDHGDGAANLVQRLQELAAG